MDFDVMSDQDIGSSPMRWTVHPVVDMHSTSCILGCKLSDVDGFHAITAWVPASAPLRAEMSHTQKYHQPGTARCLRDQGGAASRGHKKRHTTFQRQPHMRCSIHRYFRRHRSSQPCPPRNTRRSANNWARCSQAAGLQPARPRWAEGDKACRR